MEKNRIYPPKLYELIAFLNLEITFIYSQEEKQFSILYF